MGSWQVPLCAEMKFNELRSSIFCSKKRSKQPTRTFLKRHKRRKRQHTSKRVISHVRGEKCTLFFFIEFLDPIDPHEHCHVLVTCTCIVLQTELCKVGVNSLIKLFSLSLFYI